MSKIICYMDGGTNSVCTYDYLDNEQIIEIFGDTVIDCEKCDFYKKHKGKEREEGMFYTAWTGFLEDSHDDEI